MDKRFLPAIGGALLVLSGGLLALAGDPTIDEQVEGASGELDQVIQSRDRHIDPWELYKYTHNNRARVFLIDVRDEADYNLFHLRYAKRVPAEEVIGQYPIEGTLVVVMSNDEARAEEAWKRLWVQGQRNAYILAGGVNLWLDVFRPEHGHGDGHGGYGVHPHFQLDAQRAPGGPDLLDHHFDDVRGDEYDFAAPPELHPGEPVRAYDSKVKLEGPVKKSGGGCG